MIYGRQVAADLVIYEFLRNVNLKSSKHAQSKQAICRGIKIKES
jgi:hypothetical protein